MTSQKTAAEETRRSRNTGTGISFGLMGPLAHMQTEPLQFHDIVILRA